MVSAAQAWAGIV